MPISTGYILPASNYASRLRDLNLSMENARIQNISSLNLVEPTKIVVQQPQSQPSTVFTTNQPIIPRNVLLQEMGAITPQTPQSMTPLYPLNMLTTDIISGHPNPLLSDIKTALSRPKFGLADKQERINRENMERINRENMAKEDVNYDKRGTKPYLPKYQPLSVEEGKERDTNIENMAKEDVNIKELDDRLQQAYNLATKLANAKEYDVFNSELTSNENKRISTSKAGRGNTPMFKIVYIDKKGKKVELAINNRLGELRKTEVFDFIKSNPAEFLSMTKEYIDRVYTDERNKSISGFGLVKPSYMKNGPNFGNLFLNQKMLKTGTLSIVKPYSNAYIVHEKTISPLLKKMVIDIANTLEFDKQDYHNLDGNEKRVIERIVRAQKDMKETNIKKLIDEDDYKMKKRLQILVGEINAGNSSNRIINEMMELHKGLLDNGAITYRRYVDNIKQLKKML